MERARLGVCVCLCVCLLPQLGLLSAVLKSFYLPLFQSTSVFKRYYSLLVKTIRPQKCLS